LEKQEFEIQLHVGHKLCDQLGDPGFIQFRRGRWGGSPDRFRAVGMRPCQSNQEDFTFLKEGRLRDCGGQLGLRRPAGIAGFLEKPGSGPHPGLQEAYFPGPSHSFILEYILQPCRDLLVDVRHRAGLPVGPKNGGLIHS
jgi:hypothetical protein